MPRFAIAVVTLLMLLGGRAWAQTERRERRPNPAAVASAYLRIGKSVAGHLLKSRYHQARAAVKEKRGNRKIARAQRMANGEFALTTDNIRTHTFHRTAQATHLNEAYFDIFWMRDRRLTKVWRRRLTSRMATASTHRSNSADEYRLNASLTQMYGTAMLGGSDGIVVNLDMPFRPWERLLFASGLVHEDQHVQQAAEVNKLQGDERIPAIRKLMPVQEPEAFARQVKFLGAMADSHSPSQFWFPADIAAVNDRYNATAINASIRTSYLMGVRTNLSHEFERASPDNRQRAEVFLQAYDHALTDQANSILADHSVPSEARPNRTFINQELRMFGRDAKQQLKHLRLRRTSMRSLRQARFPSQDESQLQTVANQLVADGLAPHAAMRALLSRP